MALAHHRANRGAVLVPHRGHWPLLRRLFPLAVSTATISCAPRKGQDAPALSARGQGRVKATSAQDNGTDGPLGGGTSPPHGRWVALAATAATTEAATCVADRIGQPTLRASGEIGLRVPFGTHHYGVSKFVAIMIRQSAKPLKFNDIYKTGILAFWIGEIVSAVVLLTVSDARDFLPKFGIAVLITLLAACFLWCDLLLLYISQGFSVVSLIFSILCWSLSSLRQTTK